MIHQNSHLFYILRGSNDSTSWGTTNGYWPLTINCTNNDATFGRNLAAIGNVTAYSSDARLKENVNVIDSALDKVMSIGGYTFDWNEESELAGFEPEQKYNDAGVLAQEIEKVLPQAVAPAPFDWVWDPDEEDYISKSGKNYLTVRYERIVPLLIQAIKEQQEQIDELKSLIK
jgi:hypothetical protein